MARSPFKGIIAALALGLTLASTAAAQGLFSPAITVNDRVVSRYELQQRILMLEVFNTPGDLQELAVEQLIDDRLKLQALDAAGLRLTDEGLLTAMTDFAGRANLDLDQFLQVLAQNGVAEETLRDFVRVGVSWRDFVRARFGEEIEITDEQVLQALAQSANTSAGIEVLLNEIIIAAPPPRAAQAQAQAERISRLRSTAAFEAEARRVSALPSRTRGGRLDWLPLSNYPSGLRAIILALEPGEVTAPIQIPNGVALFQMRAIREVPQPPTPSAELEYSILYIPGGQSEAGLAEAARVRARADSCMDLYGIARNLPPEQLETHTLPPSQIPQDIAMELAKLDPGEVSTALTRNGGTTLMFLMLCARVPQVDGDIDLDAARNTLQGRQLAGYANALLADLRAAAVIQIH